MDAIVTLRDVTFELPNGRELFHSLSLVIHRELTALVGPNGVGKTTLARLISGELEPSNGQIIKKSAVTFFPQRKNAEAVSVSEFLGEAYVYSSLGEALLEGIHRESLCTQLSGGQWMRVRLAATLDDQFLILDEPTNDLDREGRVILAQFLSSREGGALLISHDRECLTLCDSVIELSNQGASRYGNGWLAYTEEKERERSALKHSLEKAKQDRDRALSDRQEKKERQEKRNQKGAKASAKGGQAKILLGGRKRQAQATTGKLDAATLNRANETVRDIHEALSEQKVEPVMYADLLGSELPAQKLVAEARAFNIRFSNWLYPKDLQFSLRGNVRMALKGGNGSGKSTLLKAIMGEKFETRGELKTGDLKILYLDQSCAFLEDDKTVFENVLATSALTESEIRNGLAQFLFAKEAVFHKVKDLSGGERLRAALAKGFLSVEKPELLILDEPTNNLDLANVEFLENLVSQFKAALIVISHDEVFLENCGVTEEMRF